MKTMRLTSLLCIVSIGAFAAPAHAQSVLTTHRLPAALASEAAAAAVESCAKQGYKVTASIIDTDGVVQAMLRGDGASMTTPGAARDKAYTAIMLGAPRNEAARSQAHGRQCLARRPRQVAARSTVAGRAVIGRRRGHRRDWCRRRTRWQSRRSVRQGRPRQDRGTAEIAGAGAISGRFVVKAPCSRARPGRCRRLLSPAWCRSAGPRRRCRPDRAS